MPYAVGVDGRQGDYVAALDAFISSQPVRRREMAGHLREIYPTYADDSDLRPGGSKTPTWMHDMDWALQKLKEAGTIVRCPERGIGWWKRA